MKQKMSKLELLEQLGEILYEEVRSNCERISDCKKNVGPGNRLEIISKLDIANLDFLKMVDINYRAEQDRIKSFGSMR